MFSACYSHNSDFYLKRTALATFKMLKNLTTNLLKPLFPIVGLKLPSLIVVLSVNSFNLMDEIAVLSLFV